jgi:hypothetical protein
MTSSLGAYYSDQQVTIYQVQEPVPLPVREPSDAERQALGPTPAGTPYPHAPWLKAEDESVEVHYTISNVDDEQHTVWMLIDPWNEFVRWNPGVQVVSDEVTVPNFGYDLPFIVPGKSRVQGTITPDDMHEIAIKLASVENLLASPQAQQAMGDGGAGSGNMLDVTAVANNIFNPLNRSNGNDPLYTPWIPPVIAGVTGFDLGLRALCTMGSTTNGGVCAAPNIAIEIIIDVQDLNGNRFVEQGTQGTMGPPSHVLSPPAARF